MQTETQGTPSRRRVLVVEDTTDIRELLAEILSEEGYEVVSAANGAEALAALQREPFQLVLLDLMMPIMNGFELLTRLQSRGDSRPPIVAMSAFERFRREASELGAESFLSKPVDIDRLLQEVNRIVSVHKKAGGAARASALEPGAPTPGAATARALRLLELWLQVERATFRGAETLRTVPHRSMLVLGDASAEEEVPGGLYVRLVVQRAGEVAGFLELADGRVRDLPGEELALAQFVADWIGAEGETSNDIGTGVWSSRLAELVAAVVFEQARRDGTPLLLAVLRGENLDVSALGDECLLLSFAGVRSPGELMIVGNGRVSSPEALGRCAAEMLGTGNPRLRKAAVGLLQAPSGAIPLFSEALAAVAAESRRIEKELGAGVGRVSLPGWSLPKRIPSTALH